MAFIQSKCEREWEGEVEERVSLSICTWAKSLNCLHPQPTSHWHQYSTGPPSLFGAMREVRLQGWNPQGPGNPSFYLLCFCLQTEKQVSNKM